MKKVLLIILVISCGCAVFGCQWSVPFYQGCANGMEYSMFQNEQDAISFISEKGLLLGNDELIISDYTKLDKDMANEMTEKINYTIRILYSDSTEKFLSENIAEVCGLSPKLYENIEQLKIQEHNSSSDYETVYIIPAAYILPNGYVLKDMSDNEQIYCATASFLVHCYSFGPEDFLSAPKIVSSSEFIDLFLYFREIDGNLYINNIEKIVRDDTSMYLQSISESNICYYSVIEDENRVAAVY